MSDLLVHSAAPYNAEPPLDRLRAAFVTPEPSFYVRSHGDVPRLDAAHRIRVDGQVAHPQDYDLAALQRRFAARRVMATMQCAGNRRADMGAVAPVSGTPWSGGAIGNGEWTGVALADVLDDCGAAATGHVAFDAADRCQVEGREITYGVSIPLEKARAPEVLLAWALNDEPLTPAHGFPLRVVTPGYAGARSPKWLTAMRVQAQPSDNYYQADDYRLFPASVTKETAKGAHGTTINAMPVNATICEPGAAAELAAGRVELRGYAVASGRAIARVEVSADDGATWHQATLEDATPWSWTFWHATLDLPRGNHILAVRAWDEAGQTQPARGEDTWNHKGYLSTAWHKVPVYIT